MPGFFETLADLIGKALETGASDTLPPAPQVIRDLGDWLDKLKDISIEVDGDLQKLQDLLDHLKPPGGADGAKDLGDSMLVRMLQHSFPRIAEGLTLLGLIEYQFDAAGLRRHRIQWSRISDLTSTPGALLHGLLAPIIDDPDSAKGAVNAHLLTVHLAALLVAPRPLLLLEHDRRGIASLPATPDDPPLGFLGDPWKPLNDAPWLFKPELPVPSVLKDLKPDAAGVAAFLAYLETRRLPPLTNPITLPELPALPTLPSLPTPALASPPLVLPTFRRGSVQFGLVARWEHPTSAAPIDIGNGWKVVVQGPQTSGAGISLSYDGTAWKLNVEPASLPPDIFTVSVQNSEKLSLFKTGPFFIEVEEVSAFARLNKPEANHPLFSLGLRVAGLRAGLKSDYLSPFGMSDALQASLDIDTTYDEGRGLRVEAGGRGTPALGIDFVQPINRSFGVKSASLTLQQARLRVEAGSEGGALSLVVELRLSVTAQLGPVNATITDFGAWAGRRGGKSFGVLGPQGVGVRIDAGLVQGGGFMAESPPDSGRFLGALSLKVLAIGVGAFGIYEKTREGRLSFVVVIGVRLPGIQLGFGFMLTGIGGVVGINRRADVDMLANRLASGAAGNVLFCEDPVRNAPALFDDLAAFFPPADGVFIVGPTLQISWLFIVRLDLGILIELPPGKILIVGSARATIPGIGDAVPLVNLRIDIIGGIDLSASLVFFDASLVDSTVLGIFTLTGDAAFRFSYGASAYVLLSIGGFHPSYNPEPIKIRKLARCSAGYSIDAGVHIWMRSTFYFAFTPNTLQLGGGVEAGLEIGPVGAHGFFAFDALVQFKPFYFQFDISAGFDLEFDGDSLCSINLEGHVSGPGPVILAAAVSFKILFIRLSFDKTFTLGSGNGDVQKVDVDVLTELLKEVTRIENVHTEEAERAVILKKNTAQDIALVSAASKITWTQRLAPFDVRLQRFGGTPLSREYQISLTPDTAITTAQDVFGLGSYANVDASQALNNDTFHRLKAGLTLASTVKLGGTSVPHTVTLDVVHIPSHVDLFSDVLAWNLAKGLHGAVLAPGASAKAEAGPAMVEVRDEAWKARRADGQVIVMNEPVSAFQAFQEARASGGFAVPAEEKIIDLEGAVA